MLIMTSGKNWRLTERRLYGTENSGHLDHRVAVLLGRRFYLVRVLVASNCSWQERIKRPATEPVFVCPINHPTATAIVTLKCAFHHSAHVQIPSKKYAF